jgi:hypothetical protein
MTSSVGPHSHSLGRWRTTRSLLADERIPRNPAWFHAKHRKFHLIDRRDARGASELLKTPHNSSTPQYPLRDGRFIELRSPPPTR